jgi:hypothetical protein
MKRGAGKSASGYALRGFAGATAINDSGQEAKNQETFKLVQSLPRCGRHVSSGQDSVGTADQDSVGRDTHSIICSWK